MDPFSSFSESDVHDKDLLIVEDELSQAGMAMQDLVSEASMKMTLDENVSAPTSRKLIAPGDPEFRDRSQTEWRTVVLVRLQSFNLLYMPIFRAFMFYLVFLSLFVQVLYIDSSFDELVVYARTVSVSKIM